jgi:PRTRC genetic system protein C
MLITNNLPRIFLFEKDGTELRLSDPGGQMIPDHILNFYSQTYPILATAKIEGPEIKDDEVQYRFVSTLGTKG